MGSNQSDINQHRKVSQNNGGVKVKLDYDTDQLAGKVGRCKVDGKAGDEADARRPHPLFLDISTRSSTQDLKRCLFQEKRNNDIFSDSGHPLHLSHLFHFSPLCVSRGSDMQRDKLILFPVLNWVTPLLWTP